MDLLGVLGQRLEAVDHLAIAVEDLDGAVAFYRDRLGFRETERRTTQGAKTGMESVVMEGGPLKIVLLKGTSPESQVSRYVAEYGPGVQHVAFRVKGIDQVVADLSSRGLEFDTGIIQGSGLRQAFSRRESVSGMMFENNIPTVQTTGRPCRARCLDPGPRPTPRLLPRRRCHPRRAPGRGPAAVPVGGRGAVDRYRSGGHPWICPMVQAVALPKATCSPGPIRPRQGRGHKAADGWAGSTRSAFEEAKT